MKLGIVTFHKALNYGAVLQTYALCSFLNRSFPEAETEVVDYRCPELSRFYSLRNQCSGNIIKSVAKCGHFLLKRKMFEDFSKRYIPISTTRYDEKTVVTSSRHYDKLIAGSDQIWNPELTDSDINYLLAFAPEEMRYSYAASVGRSDLPEAVLGQYICALNGYREISVREPSSAGLLQNIGVNVPICSHMDPTLLLTRQEWELLCEKNPAKKEPYILVFTVNYSEKLIQEAVSFGKKRDLDIIYVGQHTANTDVKYMPLVSVERLLALFRDARYVFTNSFHGTAFSVIFQKSFYSRVEHRDGRDSRITDLLQQLELNSHLDMENIDCPEEWAQVEQVLARERLKSKDYLKWVVFHEN